MAFSCSAFAAWFWRGPGRWRRRLCVVDVRAGQRSRPVTGEQGRCAWRWHPAAWRRVCRRTGCHCCWNDAGSLSVRPALAGVFQPRVRTAIERCISSVYACILCIARSSTPSACASAVPSSGHTCQQMRGWRPPNVCRICLPHMSVLHIQRLGALLTYISSSLAEVPGQICAVYACLAVRACLMCPPYMSSSSGRCWPVCTQPGTHSAWRC